VSAQLAILGLLVEQPLHGYGVERIIEQRGMRKWTPIGFSSIYHLLDQLVADGLATVSVEPAPGRGKERRIHAATPKGRRLWETETLQVLADVEASPGEFLLALSGFPLLDRGAAGDALARWRADLEHRITDLDHDEASARPMPPHAEAMFDFIRSRLAAEGDWLARFLDGLPDRSEEAPS